MERGSGERARTLDPRPSSIPAKATEDFLFHLYRGSELLQDNRVPEAREELERALRLEPGDAKGQDLLGVAYFRLGLFPRAIEIYEKLLALYPNDPALGQNLSLCYLKIGDPEKARAVLEDLVISQPAQKRAWSYLGLAHERLGDFHKARVAFERGEQHALARRMDERLSTPPPPPPPSSPEEPAHVTHEVPLEAAVAESDALPNLVEMTRSGRLAFPLQAPLATTPGGMILVRIEAGFALRCSAVHLVAFDAPDMQPISLTRRVRDQPTGDPLGGHEDPLVLFPGPGRATLLPRGAEYLWAFRMDGDIVFVKEAALVAFESSLSYENGRLAAFEENGAELVQLRGAGGVVLSTQGEPLSFDIRTDSAALFGRDAILGWTGRILPRPLSDAEAPARSGLVSLAGEGTVFLSSAFRMPGA